MKKTIDVSKFRKNITKNINNISLGFHDPETWIDTGNYALNYTVSGDFFKGIPLGKVTILAGESGCIVSNTRLKIRLIPVKEEYVFDKGQYNNFDGTDVYAKELEDICKKLGLGIIEQDKRQIINQDKFIIEIDTPDGWQRITHFVYKGVMPTVKITTIDGRTTHVAENHLFEVFPTNDDGIVMEDEAHWKFAKDIKINEHIFAKIEDGYYKWNHVPNVVKIEKMQPEECYDFTVDHPNHRYWSDGLSSHNSGKSYIASGNLIKNAQKQDIFVVLIDTENALDESWLHALGVSTEEDKLLKINAAMIDDVAKIINDFMDGYKQDYADLPKEERPKVLFVIDSLGMLMTPTDVAQFEKGDLKGDMGRKPKALKALITNCVNMFGEYDIGLVCTNHTYASQDMFDPDPKVSGGSGPIFAASILLVMGKRKLKEDEEGNKVAEVLGIRSAIKCMKTRYNRPFEEVVVYIPYSTGMNAFSGLVELFEKNGLLTKDGNKLKYTYLDGTENKWFRKEFIKDTSILEKIMLEFPEQIKRREQKEEKIIIEDNDIET